MTLQFSLASVPPELADTACAVVGVYEHGVLSSAAARIDGAAQGALKRLIESGDLTAKAGSILTLFGLPSVKAPRVLVVGLGDQKSFDAARFQKISLEAARALKGMPVKHATSWLTELDVPGKDGAWRVRTAALAADHAAYKYTATLKPKANGNARDGLEGVAFVAGEDARAGLAQAAAIAAGVKFARELGNLPPNICNPAYVAAEAKRIADTHAGVTLEVLEREDMEKLGMGALLGVARGSANPPKLVVLQWKGGRGDEKPYALVGKGITFDSGGLSLKPGAGMEEMKFDMCGAAGVMGAFLAAVEMKLPLNLVCVVPAVENMPDGNAYRPSDVVTTMSGITVEVLNTDAEGRLILCDALSYVQRFQPQAIVDAATLTGACVVALGKHATGLMSKHDDLAEQLLAAGEHALDRGWRLPLWDDYQVQLESGFADVANIGGKNAGAITAGCFLARFVEGQRWAHLDIAGTAWEDGRKGLATGRPVPMLAQFLIDRCG
ncbi:aminopeptidase A [Mizugakiibacter sediminis]|uniref:Probable cytosol aminopeptidase n=1 Tax=Mizugakiibacter sediminis TaxID=1475481 RepID=A0A0K8QQF5_9GAMM|nr:leucyl aminopeptidase [Mizugakiibacter sediminis]GAP67118.1 aminopeptidase A [Mizugakiibacter sediminis]